jgi:hypothetical protein
VRCGYEILPAPADAPPVPLSRTAAATRRGGPAGGAAAFFAQKTEAEARRRRAEAEAERREDAEALAEVSRHDVAHDIRGSRL